METTFTNDEIAILVNYGKDIGVDITKQMTYDEQKLFLDCLSNKNKPDANKCEHYKGLDLDDVIKDIKQKYPGNTIYSVKTDTYRLIYESQIFKIFNWCPNRIYISYMDGIVIKVWTK